MMFDRSRKDFKMKIIYRILLLTASTGLSAALSAQNLDPTVVVSRDYEGKLMEVHKPKLEMAVPDSVLRFDLEFDYSVSDSPYKGAYDFSPYLLDMRPSPAVRERNRLYVNAGAGYGLHPQLDLLWSPILKGNSFRINAYARHRSYFGEYWDIRPEISDGVLTAARTDQSHKGQDLKSVAGINGKLDWKTGALRFDLGYYGLYQQDEDVLNLRRSFNALDARFGIGSKNRADAAFGYDLEASYRYGNDALSEADVPEASLSENLLDVRAAFFFGLGKGGRVALDADYDMVRYSGWLETSASCVEIAPRYLKTTSLWDICLGLSFAKVLLPQGEVLMYGNRIQKVYPDVKVGFKGIPGLYMYLAAEGGPVMNTYSSLLESDRRFTFLYARTDAAFTDVTDEKISAVFGLDGRITPRFSYSLKGGYAEYSAAPLSSLLVESDRNIFVPAISYASFGKAFAELDFRMRAERFDIDGAVEYGHYIPRDETPVFHPAALTGDLSFRYNWMKRIYAGVNCGFATARKGSVLSGDVIVLSEIPGYADLGVELEYFVNKKTSVWAKGGNLVGMTIQRSILYAEKGPYFTLGFSLNL